MRGTVLLLFSNVLRRRCRASTSRAFGVCGAASSFVSPLLWPRQIVDRRPLWRLRRSFFLRSVYFSRFLFFIVHLPFCPFFHGSPCFLFHFRYVLARARLPFGWCSRGWFRLRFFFARLFVLSRCSSVRTFRLRSLEIQLVARAPSFPPGVCFWSRLISACLKAFPSVFVFESSVWLLSGAFSLLRLLV